jgi:CheY-like chemotaxis protein
MAILQGKIDLLLLDIHMPVLDGFQVIEAIRLREQSTGGHLPVIALPPRSRREDRERCLAAGMDDYLAKPIRAANRIGRSPQPPHSCKGWRTRKASHDRTTIPLPVSKRVDRLLRRHQWVYRGGVQKLQTHGPLFRHKEPYFRWLRQ